MVTNEATAEGQAEGQKEAEKTKSNGVPLRLVHSVPPNSYGKELNWDERVEEEEDEDEDDEGGLLLLA